MYSPIIVSKMKEKVENKPNITLNNAPPDVLSLDNKLSSSTKSHGTFPVK